MTASAPLGTGRLVLSYLAAVIFASLVASAAMAGLSGVTFLLWPVTMFYIAITALPLYGVTLAVGRPGWMTATCLGVVCTAPLWALLPGDWIAVLRMWILPGALGGLSFHMALLGMARIQSSPGSLP